MVGEPAPTKPYFVGAGGALSVVEGFTKISNNYQQFR